MQVTIASWDRLFDPLLNNYSEKRVSYRIMTFIAQSECDRKLQKNQIRKTSNGAPLYISTLLNVLKILNAARSTP